MTTTESPTEERVGYVEHVSLAAALAAFQAELPVVGKNKTANTGTYSYKYADLADVAKVGHPALSRHGLSFSAKPTLNEEGKFVLAYTLRHDSGGEDSGEFPLPSAGDMQKIGGAVTYARRYALCAVTGIVADEDADGRETGEVRTESPRRGRTMQRQSAQNGNARNGQSPSDVEAARDGLAALAEAEGHDWITVRKAFKAQTGEVLAKHQGVAEIRGFTDALRSEPARVLALAEQAG